MKYLFFIFGIIGLLLSCNSCDPLNMEDRCKRDYLFSIPVTLSPALDTFHRGDTITIEMKFPIIMENLIDFSLVDMSNFPFGLETSSAWFNFNPAVSAEKDFEYLSIIGDIDLIPITSGVGVNLNPILIDGKYIMEFKVVLDSTGLTGIGFSNREPLGGYPSSIEPDCKANSIKFLFSTNNQEDNNFEFLQYSEDPLKKNLTKEFFDSSGTYMFFVIE